MANAGTKMISNNSVVQRRDYAFNAARHEAATVVCGRPVKAAFKIVRPRSDRVRARIEDLSGKLGDPVG